MLEILKNFLFVNQTFHLSDNQTQRTQTKNFYHLLWAAVDHQTFKQQLSAKTKMIINKDFRVEDQQRFYSWGCYFSCKTKLIFWR